MPQPAAEAIQSPDDERVGGTQVVQAGTELGAVLERSRAGVLVGALAASRVKRVELEVEVL